MIPWGMATYTNSLDTSYADSETRRLGQRHRLETGLALAVNDASRLWCITPLALKPELAACRVQSQDRNANSKTVCRLMAVGHAV